MDISQAVLLGVVQGLTEFLPISSSGHLILIPNIFGWEDFTNNLLFDVAVHLGTALAVIIFFWNDWVRIVRAFLTRISTPKQIISDPDSRLLLLIIIGTIPAVIIGLLFKDLIVEQLRDPRVVAITLIVFAFVLWAADKLGSKTRSVGSLNLKDAILIGFSQALALIPGVSRSGITISVGLFSGLDRQGAARFSFMLSTPVIVGAGVLSLKEALEGSGETLSTSAFAAGMLASAMVGFLAIKYMLKFISSHNYNVFVWYRVAVGIIALLIFFR